MNILLRLKELTSTGFGDGYLLVFTMVIWTVFGLIYFSNPHNPLNQWCYAAGMISSLGTLKEYLFYEVGPHLYEIGLVSLPAMQVMYGLLSEIVYYLTLPTLLVFALFFSHAEESHPQLFPKRLWLCYLPAAVMAALFPFPHILQLQSSPVFCLSVAGYNWVFGGIVTALLVSALYQRRLTSCYRQQRLVAVSVLLPMWTWLISAFPYHSLGIGLMEKTWQFNLIALALLLLFSVRQAFREGIWGLRLRWEDYAWSSGEKTMQNNVHFLTHAIKNDLSKINWCVDILQQKGASPEELEIIRNSTQHLNTFLQRTRYYANEITLCCMPCDIGEVFSRLHRDFVMPKGRRVTLKTGHCDCQKLTCDEIHLEEVLHNLIDNAVDAVGQDGIIELSYRYLPKQHRAIITVSDNGTGIANPNMQVLAEPFYTTKKTSTSMGLGLYYCWNVMQAHRGGIQVQSTPNQGSTFSLIFPVKRKIGIEKGYTRNEKNPADRRGGR